MNRELKRLLHGVLATAVAIVALAGCGGSGRSQTSTSNQTEQPAPTALRVSSPTSLTIRTSAPSIVFKGTATPGAQVNVEDAAGGHTVTAVTGTWQVPVQLSVGQNPVTVAATGPQPGESTGTLLNYTITRTQTPAQRAAAAQQAAAQNAAAAQRAAAAQQAAAQKAAADKQAFINAATTIPYADLIKDTTPFVGKKIQVHGQILQIQQQQGQGGVILLSVTDLGNGLWTDNVWVDYDHDVSYVMKDLITVYGNVTGSKSYQTQAGGNTYVPEVHAVYIEAG